MGGKLVIKAKRPFSPSLLFGDGLSATVNAILQTESANLLTVFPVSETSGSTADNAEGTAARDGTISSVTLNSDTFLDGSPAGLWVPASNSYIDIYSSSLQSAWNGEELTMLIFSKIRAASVLTDGANRVMMNVEGDNSNRVQIFKRSQNNEVRFVYSAAGTTLAVNNAFSSTDWSMFTITASLANDRARAYINNAQVGSDLTGLGTWDAAGLDANECLIGANSTSTLHWDGYLAVAALWSTELTAAQITNIYTVATA